MKGKSVQIDDSEQDSGKDTDIDCASVSDLESLCNSSDEEDIRRKKKGKYFNPDTNMDDPKFCVGLVFLQKILSKGNTNTWNK